MASAETSPTSSFEFSGYTMAAESTPPTNHIATPKTMGELTVVKVDPQKHPKNKRKRTQAGDKTILESAYQENPKPDKIARLEIVKRVSLNEKEVQIWFQNRRQNDRRKSRPLTPQEIAALRCGGIQIISELSLPKTSLHPENPYSPAPSVGAVVNASSHASPALSQEADSPHFHGHGAGSDVNESPVMDSEVKPEDIPRVGAQTPSPPSASTSPAISQSFPGAGGFLSNRWNPLSSFSTPSALAGGASDEAVKLDSLAPSSCSSTRSDGNVLPRPSRVRLRATHVRASHITSGPTPEPATEPQCPPQHNPTPISALTGSLPPPRLSRGRSRDVNAWELCCDDDAPDDLTKMAENEANGSALAAISLLRSSGSVLQPNGSKRNAPLARRSQLNAKKTKLGRSFSSISRLSSGPLTEVVRVRDENDEFPEKDAPSKKLKVSMLVSPSGDSDKENWSPDEEGNLPFGRTATRAHFWSIRANTAPLQRRGLKSGDEPVSIFEDDETRRSRMPEEEVERFMRGDVSPSKKGDADCVAGLLALSQGNWR
ncbi:unnamed protein product [Parascedosporium putredinis]|uniref:Homeobox domain-containing protein n=1 Tax=Parascedosporium putredinis TaxID=1442378 RepID=A0A9P1H4V0_9PEZI|nr:unnamed protein product [Parascedosporium putredinis]CAI7998626.1 unnamed protein product [Parascedosporium putredinis]